MIRLPIWIFMWLLMVSIKAFPLLLIAPFGAYFYDYSLWWMILPVGVAPLGLVVVPLLYRYRNTDYSQLPFWTKPWANPEDWQGQSPDGNDVGSLPRWWIKREGDDFKAWWRYHAIRNPANGLRSYELLDLTIVPEKLEYRTNLYMDRYDVSKVRELNKKTVWYVCWQGWQMGFEIIHIWNDEHHLNLKWGWRCEPNDKNATDLDKLGIKDASFASKTLFYRKG